MSYMQQNATKRAYGPCDSFFIESDDHVAAQSRIDAKEKARAFNRNRLRDMAEELSRKTADLYQNEILDHMEYMEAETLPDVNSIEIQTEIQWYMRPYLLDFLIEAHSAFQLLPETLYLAVNLLDRYCSKRVVYKRHYQLVGCAALLIAAKYGDRKDRVPTVRELKGMCCSLYEDEMFTQMEYHVLATLNWMIGHPTVDSFLQLAMAETAYDPEVEHMAWYICEIALFHKEFVSILPSVLARSALALTRCILSRSVPNQTEWSSRYDPVVVVSLSQKVHQPSAVLSNKYASPSLSYVSNTLELFLQQQAQLARQPPPPTPPLEMDTSEGEKSPVDGQSMPHTPQKGQHLSTTMYGYMTPPVTPENDANSTGGVYCKGYAPTSVPRPSTPSPPSSVGQHIPQQYHYNNLKLPAPHASYEVIDVRDFQPQQHWNSVTLPAVHVGQHSYYMS